MAISPFSRLVSAQLKSFGLNPLEWSFDTWICLREKSFVLRHRDDSEFKLLGCLAHDMRGKDWRLESLTLASL